MSTILGILLVIAGLVILMRRFWRPTRGGFNRSMRRPGSRRSIDLSTPSQGGYDCVDTCSEPRAVNAQQGVPSMQAEPATPAQPAQPTQPSRVVGLSVMATEQAFEGYALLQALLACAMRYGEREIFHRYDGSPQSGNIVFSLASIKKPGTFDLPTMGEFSTPGLMLFMQVDQVHDALAAFDTMLQTAQQLAETLGGQLADESRRALDANGVAQIRDSLVVPQAI